MGRQRSYPTSPVSKVSKGVRVQQSHAERLRDDAGSNMFPRPVCNLFGIDGAFHGASH